MGNEAAYLGVIGWLGWLSAALNANASDLEAGRRLASGMPKLLQEHYGIRSEKLAELGLQPFRGRKPQTPKSPTPSEPAAPGPDPATTTAHFAAGASSTQ
jgi:hypothetical protein